MNNTLTWTIHFSCINWITKAVCEWEVPLLFGSPTPAFKMLKMLINLKGLSAPKLLYTFSTEKHSWFIEIRSVMVNLWHVCQRRHTNMFWVTCQYSTASNNKSLPYSWMIFRSCRDCVRMGCVLAQASWNHAWGPCSQWLQNLWKNHNRMTHAFAHFWRLQRLQQSILQSCFQGEGFVRPRAASGRPQRPVNRKRTQPEDTISSVQQILGSAGLQKQSRVAQGLHILENSTRWPIWVAVMALGLKSRMRPNFTLSLNAAVQSGLDWGGSERIVSLLFRAYVFMTC